MMKLIVAFRNISNAPKNGTSNYNCEIMEYFCDNWHEPLQTKNCQDNKDECSSRSLSYDSSI